MQNIPPLQLEAMLQRAAEAGADAALRKLGLHDDDATHDVAELRSLLDSWRDVRQTMLKTAAAILTTFVLGLMAVGTVTKFWKGDP